MACPWVLDWLWPLKALLSETDSWTACRSRASAFAQPTWKNYMRGGCKRCVEMIDIKTRFKWTKPLKILEGIQSLPKHQRDSHLPTNISQRAECLLMFPAQTGDPATKGRVTTPLCMMNCYCYCSKKTGSISAWILSIFVPNTLMNCGNTLKGLVVAVIVGNTNLRYLIP